MAPTAAFRLPRLQFSLRMLLLLMFLIGVAIAVFRWPWTETETNPQAVITSRYHRNWNGKPVKHGLELEQNNGYARRRWYDEGDLRRDQQLNRGVVVEETNYRNGIEDGPFWSQNSEARIAGTYRAGQRHGEWSRTTHEVILREQWQAGQLHGSRIWTTPGGRVLQAAEYEDGQLVSWNGRPIAVEARRWVMANVQEAELQQQLLGRLQRMQPQSSAEGVMLSHCEVAYVAANGKPLGVQWDSFYSRIPDFHANRFSWTDRSIIEVLLRMALDQSHTLACRFGMLHIVPITAESLDWRDRTGVYDVKFAEGTKAAKFWLEPVILFAGVDDHAAARFQDILFSPDPALFELDLSHLKSKPINDAQSILVASLPRPRREQLGRHLNRDGCYVEQQGNKLIIMRHADQPRAK